MNYAIHMTAYVATVTATKAAKLHLDIAGRAQCGTRGDIRLEGNKALAELTTTDADQLCKRCLNAIRHELDREIAQAAGGGQSQQRRASIENLRALRKAIQTDAEYRATIEFADELRAQHIAPPVKPARKNAFAELRDAYAAANEPRQLALAA
jgi:hypothetical protein